MGEASWYKALAPIFPRQFDGYMTTETRTSNAHIDGDIDNAPPHHTHQYPLRIWILEMQSS